MRGERTAASGQDRKRAVGKTLKMRALSLKSKAGSKCWLSFTPLHTHVHTHTLILFHSLRKGVHEMKQHHTTKA